MREAWRKEIWEERKIRRESKRRKRGKELKQERQCLSRRKNDFASRFTKK